MKKNIYAIFDKKANEYRFQIQEANDAVAVRQVTNAVNDNDSKSELSLNNEDFQLYKLGSIDTTTGVLESKIEFMHNLAEFKRV